MAAALQFLRFVGSRVDENKSMQKELLNLMRTLFGHAMVRTPLKDSAEIDNATARRSEEHTSELQSLMRISYAVFCLKKKKQLRTYIHYYMYKYIILNKEYNLHKFYM